MQHNMNKKTIIGIIIGLIGLALMGYSVGVSDKTGESVGNLFYLGMVLALSSHFAHFLPNKKDKTNNE